VSIFKMFHLIWAITSYIHYVVIHLFFYKNSFIRTRGQLFAQNLRTNQHQQKYKVSDFMLKYSEQNSSKCRTIRKCILLHAYLRTTASSRQRENK